MDNAEPDQVGEQIAERMRRHGKENGAYERNLAKLPIGTMLSPAAAALVLRGSGDHRETEWEVKIDFRNGQPLTPFQQEVLMVAITRYLRVGAPRDGIVHISIREIARELGREHDGGKDLRDVAAAFEAIAGVLITSRFSSSAGLRQWSASNLLTYDFKDKGSSASKGWIQFPKHMADLLRAGTFTLVHLPTFRVLRRKNDAAARLWLFFESEKLYPRSSREITYDLLLSNRVRHDVLPLAVIAGLSGRPDKVVAKLMTALDHIASADPRYSYAEKNPRQRAARRRVAVYFDPAAAPRPCRTTYPGLPGPQTPDLLDRIPRTSRATNPGPAGTVSNTPKPSGEPSTGRPSCGSAAQPAAQQPVLEADEGNLPSAGVMESVARLWPSAKPKARQWRVLAMREQDWGDPQQLIDRLEELAAHRPALAFGDAIGALLEDGRAGADAYRGAPDARGDYEAMKRNQRVRDAQEASEAVWTVKLAEHEARRGNRNNADGSDPVGDRQSPTADVESHDDPVDQEHRSQKVDPESQPLSPEWVALLRTAYGRAPGPLDASVIRAAARLRGEAWVRTYIEARRPMVKMAIYANDVA